MRWDEISMPAFLSRIFGGGAARKAAASGFSYVPLSEDGPMARAVPGAIVRTPGAGPPWIVVDHSIQSVVVARWPGRLWEAEVVETAPEQPREGAGYTRALAVRIGRELPVAMLFGPHGEDVVRVIEAAASIEVAQAAELAARSSAPAREAFSRAWRGWLAKVAPDSIHLDSDHTSTLAVHAAGTRSPIGAGFTVLDTVLMERAHTLVGDAAFIADDDGELFPAEPWDGALQALLDAAMALGAPALASDADRAILIEAWEHCFTGR
jgi:hypothetical protein